MRYSLIILFPFLIYACHEQGTKIPVTGIKKKIKIATDLRIIGVKGKVKYILDCRLVFNGRNKKKELQQSTCYCDTDKYNEDGYLIENSTYGDSTKLLSHDIKMYDADGYITNYNNFTAKEFIAGLGPDCDVRIINTYFYYYDWANALVQVGLDSCMGKCSKEVKKFDDKGNVIEVMSYSDSGKLWQIETSIYDTSGKLMELRNYYGDSSLNYKYVYTYNSEGQKKQEIRYYGDGVISAKTIYSYDKKENMYADTCYYDATFKHYWWENFNNFDSAGNWHTEVYSDPRGGGWTKERPIIYY